MSGHHHHHHHGDDRRLGLAVAVNLLLTVAQAVVGVLSGSLALIADALHNLSDAASLLVALMARRIARRPADVAMTFGYARIESVAALASLSALILVAFWLAAQAVGRIFAPTEVEGWPVVALAGVALVIDLITAALTFRGAKDSANIRAAFLHNLADAASSVGVMVAGAVILLWDWRLIDPLVTLAISAAILWFAGHEIASVARVLMLGAPAAPTLAEVVGDVAAQPGIEGVHRANLWLRDEHQAMFQGHVVIADDRWPEADVIKAGLRQRLADRFGIVHCTIEIESAAHACADRTPLG